MRRFLFALVASCALLSAWASPGTAAAGDWGFHYHSYAPPPCHHHYGGYGYTVHRYYPPPCYAPPACYAPPPRVYHHYYAPPPSMSFHFGF